MILIDMKPRLRLLGTCMTHWLGGADSRKERRARVARSASRSNGATSRLPAAGWVRRVSVHDVAQAVGRGVSSGDEAWSEAAVQYWRAARRMIADEPGAREDLQTRMHELGRLHRRAMESARLR